MKELIANANFRILYFISIFAPCASPPRKEVIEEVEEEKCGQHDRDGEGSDHVHDINEFLPPPVRISGRLAIV